MRVFGVQRAGEFRGEDVSDQKRYSFDTETHLLQPGLAAPPLVVAATATPEPGSERLYTRDDARTVFKSILRSGATLENTYIVYDLGVMAADDPSCLPLIFQALDEDRIYDLGTLEALHDNYHGHMFRDSAGAPIGRYSQLLLELRHLKIDRSEQKHGPDSWRLRYHELDGVPLSQWPDDATEYPRADARNAIDIATRQRFGEGRQNLQCHADEMRFAFAAQLMHIWGIRTDPLLTAKVIARIEREHHESRQKFIGSGIVRIRPVAKDEQPDKIDEVFLSMLEDLLLEQDPATEWVKRRTLDLAAARKSLRRGRGLRFALDTTRLKDLVTLAYQGEPPVTETGKVSASRDTLVESDSALLEEYGEAGANEKLFSTYRAVLLQGTRLPINAEVNAIVETQRTSMRKPNLQQLPQKGMIRECFMARGYVERGGVLERGADPRVYLTSDWVAFEMSTLAQCCINLGIESEMAKAINRDEDLHIKLAARVSQMSYAEAMALKASDDPAMANLRKAMKPVNFGLGGLLGPPRLVFTARKQDVRFCELAGVSPSCAQNPRVVTWYRRSIPPTCGECLQLAAMYKDLWYEVFPEMVEYHKRTVADADRGYVTSFGSGMIRGNELPTACSNHYFQNLAAQIAKRATYLLARESYTDTRSVLFENYRSEVLVHDEIFAEVREPFLHDCMKRQVEVMTTASAPYLTDVKVGIEPAACRRWFKGAKPVYTKVGLLKPWWPSLEKWTFEPDRELQTADLAA